VGRIARAKFREGFGKAAIVASPEHVSRSQIVVVKATDLASSRTPVV
jgi:hypothetical protein